MPKLPTAFYIFSSLLLLTLATVNLRNYLVQKKVLGANSEASVQERTTDEKHFWENFLTLNPSYVPGWIELAQVEFKAGNVEGAKKALREAQKISPNLEVGRLAPELD